MKDVQNYKYKIKENIKKLIESNRIEDAKKRLFQYEKDTSNDADIYSIKAVIAMIEGDLDFAGRVLKEGLILYPTNLDILYNEAYRLEIIGRYKESYKLYNEILKITEDKETIQLITEKLNKIKNIKSDVDFNGKISILMIKKETSLRISSYIINWFKSFGFTILKIIDMPSFVIDEHEIKQCIILYDLNPSEMSIEDKINYPDIDNNRYFLIYSLQTQLKIDFGLKNFNGFYLTQNEKEAEDIIVENLESDIMEIHDRIRQIESDYETKYTVVKMFDGFRHRAKTELIKYKDGLAVKKTWKPGNEKYLEREKFAYGILSKNISLIPKLIESGDNYIIIPYYEDLLYKNEQKKKIVLTNNIGKIASFFKQLYENDLHNPDIHPGQFIYSDNEGLKAIDFEYLQLYDKKPQSFSQSYDIVGCPNEYSGDKPNFIGNNLHRSYNDLWVKYTGYNLEQIAEIASRQYDNYDKDVEKILGLLNYAKTSGESYDGSMYDSAYHSLYIKGYYFRGQRECDFRLENVPYDFSDKVVLDIGCNAGGMLHSLKEKIKMGIGIDYDSRLINAANAIKSINRSHNLSFYTFNLEKEDLALIKNFIISKDEKVDICFLLSVCMWIDNWKEVVSFVSSISQTLLFETNGSYSQQIEQIKELEKIYNRIELIEEESRDDPGQSNRKLFLCYNNILEI